jgi:long-chain acyl-CoA synthetase
MQFKYYRHKFSKNHTNTNTTIIIDNFYLCIEGGTIMDLSQDSLTLYDIYISSITQNKDNYALSFANEQELSYKELGRLTDNLSGILLENGISKGDKVAILGANSPNWVITYFAVVTTGSVAVPILPDFTAFEIVNILEHSETKALVVSSKLSYKIPSHIHSKIPVILDLDTLTLVKSSYSGDTIEMEKPSPEDIASIIYTSGTSGASKGVMLTHANLVAQTRMSYDLFPINHNDVFLSILPLSHAYECSIGMLFPLTFGAKMFTKNVISRILYSIGIVRRALHRIAGKKLTGTFGGKLRFFGIGGSKLDGAVEYFLRDAGFPYAIGYGLTETSPLLAGATPGKVKWQSTGPALNGLKLKIIEPDNHGIGEIVAKGPNVMTGYF